MRTTERGAFLMGRKPKYTKEIKINVVKQFLNGENSITSIANDLSVNKSTIRRWVDEYRINGEFSFQHRSKNKSYSKELKETAIQSYLNGEGSYNTISLKYGLSNESILINWLRKYNKHEPIKDYDPKGDVYMKTARRKTTLEERIEIVKRCIANNNNYKETAALHDVSYAQVYGWAKKYNDFGEEGLIDGRGKKKIESSLTEIERLERKVKQLERELELKEREETVIKKLMEVERRQSSLEQDKKQRT